MNICGVIEAVENIMGRYMPPFLPEGFVVMTRVVDIYQRPALNLCIGDRDVTFFDDGTVTGSGTRVGDCVLWNVVKGKKESMPDGG